MEKAMAPHSSALAWKIPWTEEPGGLQSMGFRRVGHDWATFLSLFTFMHWRRQWQPTPVFLPGESQAPGSLVGCRLWGHTESDTTEATQQQHNLWKFLKSLIKWNTHGTCPVVQGLRLRAFTARSTGSIPGPGTKIPQCGQKFKKLKKKF